MGSRSEHALAIACVLIMCIMPVERLTKAENDITPAPTIVISELINTDAKEEKPATLSESKEEEIKHAATENSGSVEIKETINNPNVVEPVSKTIKLGKPRKHREGRWKKTLPVAKCSINEIFLFGQSSQDTVTIVNNNSNATPTDEVTSSRGTIKISVNTIEVTDTNATDVRMNDENEMKLKVADMHSFEEWRILKLKEQESKLADSEPAPARTVRAKKTQVNYGSQDCGAKVLAHNKDAKHVSAILDENRDLYMLNPCSSPIWFIIELCEPIQVQQVQLGNLELFSSAPKEFVVSVSERYPSREWRSIGTFEAANDKTLQSFDIKSNDVMFAKYIKFEMKSHFSSEHFCPLTLVRVIGISMVDEFDESEQTSSKSEAEDDSNDGSPGTNLEDSQQQDNGPINAVLNMVKNAIGLADDGKKKLAESVTEGGDDSLSSGNDDTDLIDPTVESEVTLVTNQTEIANLPVETSQLITLIKTGEGEDLTAYFSNLTSYSPHVPLYVPQFIQYLSPVTQKLNAKVCWFLEFVCKVSLTSCLVHYPFNYSVFVPFSFDSISQKIQNNIHKDSDVDKDPIPPYSDKINTAGSDALYHPDDRHLLDSAVSVVPNDDSSMVGKVPTTEHVVNEGLEPSNVADLVYDEPVKVQSCELDVEDKINPLLQLGSTNPTEPEDIVEPDNSQNLSSSSGVTEEISSQTTVDTTHEGSKIGHKSDTTTKLPVDETSEKQPTPPTVVINPVSPKDSVFMRLSNRIRVLEQNMSLSSDYLENLSRRYKEQMDEMQRAFNKTTSKLVATSRTANENDAKQTELLKKAEAEIKLLKKQIQNLSTSHDQLNSKLVERHLCLIVLEIMIFIAVFVTCLGRRISHTQQNLDRSDDMIRHLKLVIDELQQSHLHPQGANGHCKSVHVEKDDSLALVLSNTHRHEKKKKKKLRHRNSNGSITTETPTLSSNIEDVKCTDGVENIGASKACSTVDRSCCDPEKAWNSNQLGLKIPGAYIKGRK